jgi:hypothetical protein
MAYSYDTQHLNGLDQLWAVDLDDHIDAPANRPKLNGIGATAMVAVGCAAAACRPASAASPQAPVA